MICHFSNKSVVKVEKSQKKVKKIFTATKLTITRLGRAMITNEHHSTKEEILQYLLKQGEARAQDISKFLGISPQATRRHLKDLESNGQIEHQVVQQKLGRPQHIYRLSKQGREHFPNGYSNFAVSFLDTLVETVGEKQVSQILQKQWARKAEEYRRRIGSKTLSERIAKLAELRRAEGYVTELHRLEGKKFFFTEHNCAISEVAESFPSVCGHELEMFASILPDCSVERTHWINDGEHRCGYLIQAKS
jgi:DeoR family suf operon transcriptional repressor